MKEHRSHHHHPAQPGYQRATQPHQGQQLSQANRKSSSGVPTGKKEDRSPDLEELLKRWEPQFESAPDPDAEPPQSGMASLVLESQSEKQKQEQENVRGGKAKLRQSV